MPRTIIDIDGFDAKFEANPDPWNYRTSRFEAFKRKVLLQACGVRPFGRGLELACANGETTRMLARRCLKLTAVDGSKAAVEEARRRTAELSNVRVTQADLPAQLPQGAFDLIVVSELLYYLDQQALNRTLARCWTALAPGGRIVLLHHTIFFDDVAIPPARAQSAAKAYFTARARPVFHRALSHFDVAAFERAGMRAQQSAGQTIRVA